MIRFSRNQLSWSRRTLAEKSGLSENTIENIERGRRPIIIDDLIAIARALEIPLVTLLPPDLDYVTDEEKRERRVHLRGELAKCKVEYDMKRHELDLISIRMRDIDQAIRLIEDESFWKR